MNSLNISSTNRKWGRSLSPTGSCCVNAEIKGFDPDRGRYVGATSRGEEAGGGERGCGIKRRSRNSIIGKVISTSVCRLQLFA